jgi:ABC-type uncharacterized transport system auxiliary subunit
MTNPTTRPGLRRFFGLTSLLALLGIGCTQLIGGKAEIRQNRLYLIEAKTIRSFLEGSERPYPMVVEVETFDVARAYNRNEIIFRRNELEIQLDKGHTWAVRPAAMITDAVGQYLKDANLFSLVGRDFIEQEADFNLSGTVKTIERYDSGDIWFARLAISMRLVRRADAKVIWRTDFDEERQVYNADMTFTIEAMREILRQQMEISIKEIDLAFLNQRRQKEGRPLIELSIFANGRPAETLEDTSDVDEEPVHYELIPGKRVE